MGFQENIYSHSPAFLQTVLLNVKATELYLERYGKKFRKLFDQFNKNQWLSESELFLLQSSLFQALVQHAYQTVPYYRRKMDELKLKPNDIKTTKDLYKMPLLTKEDIKQNFNSLISTAIPKSKIKQGHTSGTTGTPLDVRYDIQTCVAHHAADWRQKKWAGLEYGQPYASLQGRVIVPLHQTKPPFWRKNYINNQLFLSSFHLKEENLPYYFDKLSKDQIHFIEGYPSTIYILALYLNKSGRKFPMQAVFTSSETLFPIQRQAIEKAFSCKVFDFYGMAERVVYATECDRHEGHHLNMDYGITEFLDSNNRPVEPGCLGKIVATSIHNFAMPLIRYQTNDSCALKTRRCSCGREFPLMDDVATKNEAIVTLRDGRLISPSVLTHPFKPMHNILESQIIQEDLDLLVVKLVVNENFSRDEETMLIKAFNDRLGKEVDIKVEYLDSIPKNKSGKFKWVVSKITPHF